MITECRTHKRLPRNAAGFTLIEVLAALAILGGAMFILLNAHFGAMSLHEAVASEADFRLLAESTISMAELEIRAGNLGDAGDFGTRYPGFSWTFEAQPAGSDEAILLYSVEARITGPEEERNFTFFVFDTGLGSAIEGGGAGQNSSFMGESSGLSSGSRGSGSTGAQFGGRR